MIPLIMAGPTSAISTKTGELYAPSVSLSSFLGNLLREFALLEQLIAGQRIAGRRALQFVLA
jgi:hypothetical protein